MLKMFVAQQIQAHGLSGSTLSALAHPTRRSWVFLSPALGSREYRLSALGATALLRNLGLGPLWAMTLENDDQEALRYVLDSRPSGVLVCGVSDPANRSRDMWESFRTTQTPCVFLYSWPDPLPQGTASVGYDRAGCVASLVDVLQSKGYKRIGLFAQQGDQTDAEFIRGFKQGCYKYGDDNPKGIVLWSHSPTGSAEAHVFSEREGLSKAQTLLQQRFQAVIVCSSTCLLYLLKALHSDNKSYPSDVAIAAVGVAEWMDSVVWPPITHIRVPSYDIGKKGMELLVNLASGNGSNATLMFDVSQCLLMHSHGGST